MRDGYNRHLDLCIVDVALMLANFLLGFIMFYFNIYVIFTLNMLLAGMCISLAVVSAVDYRYYKDQFIRGLYNG